MTFHNISISQYDFKQYHFTQYHHMTLKTPSGPQLKTDLFSHTFSFVSFQYHPLILSYIAFNVVESFAHSTRVESKSQRPDYHLTEYHYDQVQDAP